MVADQFVLVGNQSRVDLAVALRENEIWLPTLGV